MKESIGGIWLFNIVIFFILVFTAYICISINYSKAYNIKNEIVNIIRNQGGVCTTGDAPYHTNVSCSNFADQISDYFKEANYRSTGKCKDNEVGYDREGNRLSTGANRAAICISAVKAQGNVELPNALYYKVRVFFQLDVPVLFDIFNFAVEGETSRIYNPNECDAGAPVPWC